MFSQKSNFDRGFNQINGKILKMGGIIEQQIFEAVDSMVKRDINLAEMVINRDDEVDGLQTMIEDLCIKLIIRQQPRAKDLRAVFTGIKIVTDLERISDISVNIARITKQLYNEKFIKPLIDIPYMAKVSQKIIKLALDSYVNKDIQRAMQLSELEEEIDLHYEQVFEELLNIMMKDLKTITQGIQLLFVARQLERIGDHSTNIGEMVIYLETGERVKLNG